MTRLIDADKLLTAYGLGLETAVKYPIGDGHGYDTMMLYEIRDMIDNAPTVDAVEVVRCADCKHYRETAETKCVYSDGLMYPNIDDFCSYAERR